MPRVHQRLAELGLALPTVVAPIGAYVPAVRHGDLVWTAGQLPLVDGTLAAAGHIGSDEGMLSAERGYELARICALNALAAAGSVVELDEITRVVKVVGYVAGARDFTAHPAVVNGASDLLMAVFGEAGRHARSAVGVASLPLGAPVEVELVLAIGG